MRQAYKIAHSLRRLYWYILRPHTYGVKLAIKTPKGLWLERHSYSSLWNLPGGGYKPSHEAPEQAVIREVKEELGLRFSDDLKKIIEYESTSEYKRDHIIIFEVITNKLPIKISTEIKSVQLFHWRVLDKEDPRLAKAAKVYLKHRHLSKD